MDNAPPEKNEGQEKNMQEQAREAVNQIIANAVTEANQQLKTATNQEDFDKIQAQLSKEIEDAKKLSREYQEAKHEGKEAEKAEQGKKVQETLIRVAIMAEESEKQGKKIFTDKRVTAVLQEIAKEAKAGHIDVDTAAAIEKRLASHFIKGTMNLSDKGQEETEFEKDLALFKSENATAYEKIYQMIKKRAPDFEKTEAEIDAKLKPEVSDQEEIMRKLAEDQFESRPKTFDEAVWQDDRNQYLGRRFTKGQLDFLETLYSPEKFVEHLSEIAKKSLVEKEKITDKLKKYYQENNKTKSPGEINAEVDKQFRIAISNKIGLELGGVINQLFLELQQKTPDKFYDEIVKEDIFHGPEPVKHKIQAAINKLYTTISGIEKNKDHPLYEQIKNIKLFRFTEQHYITDEYDGKANLRLKPLPYPEEIKLSEFLLTLNINMDHTIHKMEFLHNVRAMFNHPPGKEGFYSQLSHYAESLKGTDIDEIMLLPDGQMTLQAFQLYDKMLEEDFAWQDWRHRTNQFSNQLERVNTTLENELISKMQSLYPDEPIERIRHSVNSAVGMARGMLLTEPEKSAYADPVDVNGAGLYASYSTNDAGSLNVFNPLHTGLRWQGEHLWPMFYFMPMGGTKGMWDHKQTFENMGKYMESFLAGKGRGDLPEELFADALMDIANVGGPAKRKGWRMKFSLEGHFVTDPTDGTLNVPETFKAMEAIGYEAIYNFISTNQAGEKLLKATEKTDPKQAKERKDLFRFIFKKYFYYGDPKNFKESDLDSYLADLSKKGEQIALDKLKKTRSLSSGSWEEQIAFETSTLFMENILAHYVASRFPSKFLRMTRNRFTKDGKSRWQEMYEAMKDEKGWDRDKFNEVMKDLTFAEMLLRKEISEEIRERLKLDPKKLRLNDVMGEDIAHRLDADKIKELLSSLKGVNEEGKPVMTEQRINEVVELFKLLRIKLSDGFLDGDAIKEIKDYTFTFGLEDTDLSLMAFRGTGPRMIARALGDTGNIETNIIPWIIEMPRLLNQIATSGKHDFSPIIEYLQKAQKSINQVHGTGDAADFPYIYKIASAVIQYFKKDTMAKPLFGLLKIGQRNSMAAEYAGRSSAVWEWDSRDIDRFCVALESLRLLPKNAFNLQLTKEGKYIGGHLEDRYIKLPFLKKPIKFGKQRHIDYEYNAAKLRKEFGGDWKAISFDMINQFLPLALAFLLWQYFKKAMEEAEGKKK